MTMSLSFSSLSFSLRKGRKSDVITFLMLFDRRYPVLNDRMGGTKPRYQGVLLSFSQKEKYGLCLLSLKNIILKVQFFFAYFLFSKKKVWSLLTFFFQKESKGEQT